MEKKQHNILIVGVGGQGVLLASEILSEVAMKAGYDVKKSEVHGMSQRGGVVSSHVKIAPKVYSPTIQKGQVNLLLSFERAEALRAVDWMRKDGIAIVSETTLIPAIVTSSKEFSYPDDPVAEMKKHLPNVISTDADKIAGELGNPRLVNTILLGIASNFLPFQPQLWIEVMKAKIKPKFVDINLTAFKRGQEIKLEAVDA